MEISYFAPNFIKYTPFIKNDYIVKMDGESEFNSEYKFNLEVDQTQKASIIKNIYLLLELPRVSIPKDDIDEQGFIDIKNDLESVSENLTNYNKYIKIIKLALSPIKNLLEAQGVSTNIIDNKITELFNETNSEININLFQDLKDFLANLSDSKYDNIISDTDIESSVRRIIRNPINDSQRLDFITTLSEDEINNEDFDILDDSEKISYIVDDLNLNLDELTILFLINKNIKNIEFNIKKYYQLLVNDYDIIYQEYISKKQDVDTKNIKFSWIKDIGLNAIENIRLFVDGTPYSELRTDTHKIIRDIYIKSFKEQFQAYQKLVNHPNNNYDSSIKEKHRMWLYLPFWFNRDGMGLNIVSMYRTSLELKVKLRDLNNLVNIENVDKITNISNPSIELYIETVELKLPKEISFFRNQKIYKMLDNFYTVKKYFTLSNQDKNKISFSYVLSNPTKELFWFIRNKGDFTSFLPKYDNGEFNTNLINGIKMYIGSILIGELRTPRFFQDLYSFKTNKNGLPEGVYNYSFCLNSKYFVPTGLTYMSETLDEGRSRLVLEIDFNLDQLENPNQVKELEIVFIQQYYNYYVNHGGYSKLLFRF